MKLLAPIGISRISAISPGRHDPKYGLLRNMKLIEHRRHSMRHKPGEHLKQAGVDLARRVGADIGPFDLVITSTTPRAFQTAIAMGFAVDEQSPGLETLPAGFEDEINWDAGYPAFVDAIRTSPDGAVATYARSMLELHTEIAERLKEGGGALIISHGGVVEASAVGCVPGADYGGWPDCDYCEGIRLTYDSGRFTDVELLRVRPKQ